MLFEMPRDYIFNRAYYFDRLFAIFRASTVGCKSKLITVWRYLS